MRELGTAWPPPEDQNRKPHFVKRSQPLARSWLFLYLKSGVVKMSNTFNWNTYINEPRANFEKTHVRPEYRESDELMQLREYHEERVNALDTKYRPYLQNYWVSVNKSSFPKIVIKEKTRKFPGSEKYPPYAFRLQCTVTGRQSKYIKMDEYPYYGILDSDTMDGGIYSFKQDIQNKIEPIYTKYSKLRESEYRKFRDKYDSLVKHGDNVSEDYFDYMLNLQQVTKQWFERYNEYLVSDEWKIKRKQVLDIDDKKCLVTGKSDCLQVHHITYQNVGNEQINELITLSKDVHQSLHEQPSIKRRVIEFGCLNQRKLGAFNVFDLNDAWFEIHGYDESFYSYIRDLVLTEKEQYQQVLINIDEARV